VLVAGPMSCPEPGRLTDDSDDHHDDEEPNVIRLNPYLTFDGEAREAMTFYHSVLGGELAVNTFAELHASEDPAEADKIMHAMLETPHGLTLMGADTATAMGFEAPGGFAVSLSGDDDAELRRCWEGLTAGATVKVPLEKAPWGDTFGMFTDRFGIEWMVNITG
jgi:PhnB protein